MKEAVENAKQKLAAEQKFRKKYHKYIHIPNEREKDVVEDYLSEIFRRKNLLWERKL